MNPEDSSEEAVEKPKKSLSPFLRAGVFEIAFIFFGIIVFFAILNYFNILSLSQLYPNQFGWLPQRKLPMTTITPVPSGTPSNKTFSILKLTPAPSGNPFDVPIIIKGTQVALYSINGWITDIVDSKTQKGKLLYVQKVGGPAIQEPLFAPDDLKPLIITLVNGKSKETEASLSAVRKGDSAIISYNIDLKAKSGRITGIRISR